jgi:5-methylcytosine-specific restriction endonuclease McrA
MTHSPEYERWLRSPDWAAIRRDRIIEAGWRCDHCGHLAYDLELHHKHYDTLGDESPHDLELLCTVCHDEWLGTSNPRRRGRREARGDSFLSPRRSFLSPQPHRSRHE